MTDETGSSEAHLLPEKTISLRTFFIIAAIGIVLDQLTKFAVVRHFGIDPDSFDVPRIDPVVVIDNYFQIIYARNKGAAFSMFRQYPEILTALAAVIAVGLVVFCIYLKPEERIMRLPLGMILGGAIGNLFDRFTLGYVVDFIDVHWRYEAHFATFNIADSLICVGMGWLILISCFGGADRAEAAPETQST